MSILETCPDIAAAKRSEVAFISELSPEYNMTLGGEGVHGYAMPPEIVERIAAKKRGIPAHNRGTNHSEETKEKMRAWRAANEHKPRLGKPRPGSGLKANETKRKKGLAVGGKKGVKWSGEARERMRAIKRGCAAPTVTPLMIQTRAENMRRASQNRSRPVVCLTDGRVFSSCKAAAIAIGAHRASVHKVCSTPERQSIFGLKFMWAP